EFLLREESSVALAGRLDTAHLREEEAMRYLRLGDVGEAGKLGKVALDDLTASGEGQADSTKSLWDITLVKKTNVDVMKRLDGLGRLVDATATGYGSQARSVLLLVMEKRISAIEAFSKGGFADANAKTDEA